MKTALFLAALSVLSSAHAGETARFQCANPPEKVWGEYWCIYGEYDKKGTLHEVSFSRCAGSDEAGEAEPMGEEHLFEKIAPSDELKATSRQWKDANAYDVTTDEFGEAVLYIHAEDMRKDYNGGVARLKLANGKEAKLPCVF